MKKKAIVFGREIQRCEIMYSFSYKGKTYAAVTDDEMIFSVIRLRWNPLRFLYAEEACDEAEKISGKVLLKVLQDGTEYGRHYTVSESGDIEPSRSHGLLNPLYTLISFILNTFISLIILFFGLYIYFDSFNVDLSQLVPGIITDKSIRIICLSVAVLMLSGFAFANRRKITGVTESIEVSIFTLNIIAIIIAFQGSLPLRILCLTAAIALIITAICCAFRYRKSKDKKYFKNTLNKFSFALCIVIFALAAVSVTSMKLCPGYRNCNSLIRSEITEYKFSKATKYLKEEKWEKADCRTRLKVLQTICDYEAVKNGTYSAKVISDSLDEGVTGNYCDTENLIRIDQDYISEKNAALCLETLLHEYTHIMQYYTVQTGSASEALTKNFQNYIVYSGDYFGYSHQYTEVDANLSAYKLIDETYNKFLTASEFESTDLYKRVNMGYFYKYHEKNNNGDFTYTAYIDFNDPESDPYIIIEDYTGKGGTVEIPEVIDGISVSMVDVACIKADDNVSKIIVPSTVMYSSLSFQDYNGEIKINY